MSDTTDQETFRAVMKIVGLPESTVDAIQLGKSRATLDKYNLHEYPGDLRPLRNTVSLSNKEFELLNTFRHFYTELPPSKRRHVLAHFDSSTWLDYQECYQSRQLKAKQSRSKAVMIIVLILVVVMVPVVFLQWKSLGVSQALLEAECGSSGYKYKKIPVDCHRVSCSCCYQRERSHSSEVPEWIVSGERCK